MRLKILQFIKFLRITYHVSGNISADALFECVIVTIHVAKNRLEESYVSYLQAIRSFKTL